MDQQEVIGRCVEMGIPIHHGRIDRNLFETSLRTGDPGAAGTMDLRSDTPRQ
jgi:hypothetical protein